MAGQRFHGSTTERAAPDPATATRPGGDPERTLLLALEAAGLGLHDYDVVADDIHLDARARAFWGLGPDEPFDYGAFLAGLHPDDREPTRRAVERALDPRGDGRYRAEYRVISAADGTQRTLLATGVVTFVDGRAVRLVGTLEDVTAARRAQAALDAAQARLRLLVSIGEATRAASDAFTIMASVTRLLGEHLGATRCAYADMEPDQDRFTIRDDWTLPGVASTRGTYSLALFGRSVARRLREGQTVAIHDVSRELADDDGGGTFRSIGIEAVVCCPLVKDGRLTALMAVHQATPRRWTDDEIGLLEQVVDRSWAHIERVRAAEHLREQDRRKDEFLAVLAHELRNPLAPIRTGLGVIDADPGGPAAERARALMARQLGHLVRMVDDLLDVSRISRGKLELRRQPIAAQVVIEHALEASRPLLDAAGHRVDVTSPADPVWIDGDLTRLAQVVQNLLNNAAKYTAHGGRVAVEIGVDGHFAVIVLDIGMPGLDGYEVARILRADPELGGARLVAVTGWGGPEARERARQAGFDLHLTKPVDPERIDAILAGG